MALTIEQIQDNITNGGDVRQIINQIADYVQANPGGSGGGVESVTGDAVDNTDPLNPVIDRGYKVYTALISQVSTDAPTANIKQNTLGGTVVWTRTNIGRYVGTLAGAFPESGLFIPVFGISGGVVLIPMAQNSLASHFYTLYRNTDDTIFLEVYDSDWDYVDLSAILGSEQSLPIDIKVFP